MRLVVVNFYQLKVMVFFVLEPHGLFLFGNSPKKETKRAATASNFLKIKLII